VIFAMVLLIPKLNRLRRRRGLWNLIRLVTSLAAMAVLAIGVDRGLGAAPVVVAAAMLLFALLAKPERQRISIDARRRELGALVVVDGGLYAEGAGNRRRVKLFIAADRVWVLDRDLQVLLELPCGRIRAQSVESSGDRWSFLLECGDEKREFVYEGVFAEHLARVAAAMVRSQMQRELPVLH
jgi:hypothetical protein